MDVAMPARAVQAARADVFPSSSDLQRVQSLYDASLMLQAFRASEAIGPLRAWRGAAAQVLAGRLAAYVGAPRLARFLHLAAYRGDRQDIQARYYRARDLLAAHGAYATWRFMRGFELPTDPLEAAEWLGLQAEVLTDLRDFDNARALLARSEGLAPNREWLVVQRFDLAMSAHDREGALQIARAARAAFPAGSRAVLIEAQALTALDRIPEAIAALEAACARFEVGPLAHMLARLHLELGQHDPAWRALLLARELTPLMEKEVRTGFDALACEIAAKRGARAEALALAKGVDTPFSAGLAERLETSQGGGRVIALPVPYVAQREMTCYPAVLAMVLRYWNRPADHDAITDAICFNGTSDRNARRWCESQGLVVREFRLDRATAVALLERGVPCILSRTDGIDSGHVQVVVGFDELRGTLIIQDPGSRLRGELIADKFFEYARAEGPRALLAIPADKAALLEGIALPDAELLDDLHRLEVALDVHDVDSAQRSLEAMRARAPESFVTLRGRWRLASYRADADEELACAEEHARRNPGDARAQLWLATALERVQRFDDHRAILDRLSRGPETVPQAVRQRAEDVRRDGRRLGEAQFEAARAARWLRADAPIVGILADLAWGAERWDEAVELYRFAACLGDYEEVAPRAFMRALRLRGREAEGFAFLRARAQLHGKRSGGPACTLARELHDSDRIAEAVEVLDAALALRPDDAELRASAAEIFGELSMANRARRVLGARGAPVDPRRRLRIEARIADLETDRDTAAEKWKQIAEREPVAPDALRFHVEGLRLREGPNAARAHLAALIERFPRERPVMAMLLDCQRRRPPAESEATARAMLAIDPLDAWARRELAWALHRAGRGEEAERELRLSMEIDPRGPSGEALLSTVLRGRGDYEGARAAALRALAMDAEYGYALDELMHACNSADEAGAAIAAARAQIERTLALRRGWLDFANAAARVMEPEALLEFLRSQRARRPDSWYLRISEARQLARMDRAGEAAECAREAARLYPYYAGSWFELASALNKAGDAQGELAALEKAGELNPRWGAVLRSQAEIAEKRGDLARARELLETATKRDPSDAISFGCLADLLWKLDARAEAVAALEQALHRDPEYEWALDALVRWTAELNDACTGPRILRELAADWADSAEALVLCARRLDSPEARVMLAQRAVEFEPRLEDAHDCLAYELTRAGRHAEALQACRPAAFGERLPLVLRGRAAWVEAESGNRDRAIEMMREIVEGAPDYQWGLGRLAEWLLASGQHADALAVGEKLAALDADDTWAHEVRATALIELKRFEEARAVLARTLELSPDSEWCWERLFDVELEVGDLAAAEKAWTSLRERHGTCYVWARAVQLHSKRGDWDQAKAAFVSLGLVPHEGGWPAQAALEAMAAAGWKERVGDLVVEVLERADAEPALAVAWAEAAAAEKRWMELKRVRRQVRWRAGAKDVFWTRVDELLAAKPGLFASAPTARSDARNTPSSLWVWIMVAMLASQLIRACGKM